MPDPMSRDPEVTTEGGWWHPAECIDRHDDDHNCLDEGGSIIGWRDPSFYSPMPAAPTKEERQHDPER